MVWLLLLLFNNSTDFTDSYFLALIKILKPQKNYSHTVRTNKSQQTKRKPKQVTVSGTV